MRKQRFVTVYKTTIISYLYLGFICGTTKWFNLNDKCGKYAVSMDPLPLDIVKPNGIASFYCTL